MPTIMWLVRWPQCADALSDAGISAEQLDAVAVTYGPGLVGALLVGMAAAKAFAWAHGLPSSSFHWL